MRVQGVTSWLSDASGQDPGCICNALQFRFTVRQLSRKQPQRHSTNLRQVKPTQLRFRHRGVPWSSYVVYESQLVGTCNIVWKFGGDMNHDCLRTGSYQVDHELAARIPYERHPVIVRKWEYFHRVTVPLWAHVHHQNPHATALAAGRLPSCAAERFVAKGFVEPARARPAPEEAILAFETALAKSPLAARPARHSLQTKYLLAKITNPASHQAREERFYDEGGSELENNYKLLPIRNVDLFSSSLKPSLASLVAAALWSMPRKVHLG